MIWKKSSMDLNTTAVITPKKLQEQGIPGDYGLQDRWWVDVDGEDATFYTGYYKETGAPDRYGAALRAAIEMETSVAITKDFDKAKSSVTYDITRVDPAPSPGKGEFSPPDDAKPHPSPARKSAPQHPAAKSSIPKVTTNDNGLTPYDVKSVKIGMYAGAIKEDDRFMQVLDEYKKKTFEEGVTM